MTIDPQTGSLDVIVRSETTDHVLIVVLILFAKNRLQELPLITQHTSGFFSIR